MGPPGGKPQKGGQSPLGPYPLGPRKKARKNVPQVSRPFPKAFPGWFPPFFGAFPSEAILGKVNFRPQTNVFPFWGKTGNSPVKPAGRSSWFGSCFNSAPAPKLRATRARQFPRNFWKRPPLGAQIPGCSRGWWTRPRAKQGPRKNSIRGSAKKVEFRPSLRPFRMRFPIC